MNVIHSASFGPEKLARRRPVWAALSGLFLDIELDEGQLREIAQVLVESGYTDGELSDILWREVYPACIPNLQCVAGEWAGIDLDSLQDAVLRNRKHWWRRSRLFQWSRWMIRKDWERVMAFVRERCGHCGYDLRATPERCPECGAIPTARLRTSE